MRKLSLIFVALALTVMSASTRRTHAAEIPVVAQETSVARGETRAFEFGTVPQADTTVLLEITSRLDAKALSGSSFFLDLKLNGQEVQGAKSRALNRLRNRAFDSLVTPTIVAPWFGSPRGWRVPFAPDFEGARQQKFYEGDPYTLVLDVTDLVNPAAENRLQVTNTADEGAAKAAQTEAALVIGKMTIRTVEGASPMMAGAVVVKPFINRGERAGGAAKYSARVLAGGGIAVRVGAREWKIDSAFSYPNAGFNRLVAGAQPDKTGQKEWRVEAKNQSDGGQVIASAKEYEVRRTVRFTPHKVEVSDAIVNQTDAPLGLIVRHEMDLSGLQSPVVRLAGSVEATINDYFAPGNPSVHVTAPDHTIALLCEDDVFRNQARLYTSEAQPQKGQPAVAGIRTEMLRVGPRETYVLRWSIYPVASQDYFDFINLVRHDWGANFTADGAWYWGYSPDEILAMPVEAIREKFRRLGIRYTTIGGGWVDRTKDAKRIGFGSGVMDEYWADYRRRVKESAAKIRLAVPECKVVAYYDSQRDTSEGGHDRFRDSWLTDPQNAPLSTEWSGQYSLTYSDVATTSNSYGKAMLETAEAYVKDMGLDGIYWDEMENVGFGSPLLTYNVADGHSCLIDPKTFTIQREVGNTVLLGEAHRLAVIKLIQKHGGIVLGNGPTCTRALLQTGVQRMTEVQHNDYWAYQGHLQTPLGYAGSRMDFANVVRILQLGCLPVGTRMNYDYDIGRHLFPFTPMELHSGYLLGRERLVTLHDGNYGWDGDFSYRLWIYNADGKVQDENPSWQSAKNRVPVKVPAGGVAVLERRDKI